MATSVLVIDDDASFRGLAVRMLEDLGLTVVGEAATVAAATEAASRLRPQAALVDVTLPDGSGIELASELASLPWSPRIVITSVQSDAITAAGVRSTGAAAFVAKHDLPDSQLGPLLTGQAHEE